MLDARCSMLDARCSMLDARCSMLDARCIIFVHCARTACLCTSCSRQSMHALHASVFLDTTGLSELVGHLHGRRLFRMRSVSTAATVDYTDCFTVMYVDIDRSSLASICGLNAAQVRARVRQHRRSLVGSKVITALRAQKRPHLRAVQMHSRATSLHFGGQRVAWHLRGDFELVAIRGSERGVPLESCLCASSMCKRKQKHTTAFSLRPFGLPSDIVLRRTTCLGIYPWMPSVSRAVMWYDDEWSPHRRRDQSDMRCLRDHGCSS
jgi:hypothetical protein